MNFFRFDSPFWRGINKAVFVLYTGFLWFLGSIPVVTMGASTSALLEVLMKMAKNQEGYIGAAFFRAWKSNLKQGLKLGIPLMLVTVVFGVNAFYYGVLGGKAFWVQTVLFLVLLTFALGLWVYVFAVTARFENSAGDTFRMAVVLLFRNLGWTLVIVLIQLLTLFLCCFFVYFPILFITGISGYAQACIFNHIFDRLIEDGGIQEKNREGLS